MAPIPGITARAITRRVVDGDTIDVEIRIPVRVRLLDCWAPEKNTHEGVVAAEKLRAMAPVGSPLIVQIPTQDASSLMDLFTFGRVLGNVWREGDDESLSQAMVATKNATVKKQ